MRWRSIGPVRGGRARAVAGVPSQPNVFYIGFDNGGVWRSTDYGSTWVPLFDEQPTGSIGAIAVAPSDPNIIYVGSGAGIIRPDLATGDGVYKSTDAGKTWTHLGLADSRMIANIAVDPTNPDRLFVAALGHPYGPNAERGIFRSTDGGRTFEKVLYKDEYTSGNDVRDRPERTRTPCTPRCGSSSRASAKATTSAAPGNGIFKSTDGGTTWTQLTEGCRRRSRRTSPLRRAIRMSSTRWWRAWRPRGPPCRRAPRGDRRLLQVDRRRRALARSRRTTDRRHPPPSTRARSPASAAATCRRSPSIRRTRTSSTARRSCCGAPRTAGPTGRRCAAHPAATTTRRSGSTPTTPTSSSSSRTRAPWSRRTAASRGATGTRSPPRPCTTSRPTTPSPTACAAASRTRAPACVDSRSMDGEITFHDWHPVNIQEYGIAAPDPNDPDMVYGSARTNVSLYNRKTGQTIERRPRSAAARGTDYNRNVRTMPIALVAGRPRRCSTRRTSCGSRSTTAHSWTRISPDLARPTWAVPASAGKYASSVTAAPAGRDHRAVALARGALGVIWAGTDDGNDPGHDGRRRELDQRHAERDQALDAHLQHRGGPLRHAHRVRRREHAADRRPAIRTSGARTTAGKTWTEIDSGIAPGGRSPTRSAKIRGSPGCSTPRPTPRCGSRSTTATTGSRCGSTCRRCRCATSR